MTHFTWVIRVLLTCKGVDFLKNVFFFLVHFFLSADTRKQRSALLFRVFRDTPKAGIKPLLTLLFAEILHFIRLSILLLPQILRLRLFLCFHYVLEQKKLSSHLSPGQGNSSCRDLLWAQKRKVCVRQLRQPGDRYVSGERRRLYPVFLFSTYRYHLP